MFETMILRFTIDRLRTSRVVGTWLPARRLPGDIGRSAGGAVVRQVRSRGRQGAAKRQSVSAARLGKTHGARVQQPSLGLISRNSRPARSASASSKGQRCRHYSDRRKSQAGRNSASRRRTRNNLGLDRYTKGAGCGAPCAKPKLSGRKLEGCYSGADDSPARSRSRASVAPAGYEPAQPARRPAAAIGR
jgi:hypothetical protein